MKIFNSALILGFSCYFFVHCKQGVQRDKIYRIEKYESGAVKSEGFYLFDSVRVDTFKNYWLNGKLQSLEIYDKQGKLNGMIRYFDNDGKLKQTKNYSHGKLNGLIVDYFPNSKIRSTGWIKNDHFYGDAIEYFINGMPKVYNFYDFNQENVLVREYDSLKQEYINRIGNLAVIDTVQDKGDTLMFSLLIAHPPYTKNEILLEEIGENKQILKTYSLRDSIPQLNYLLAKYHLLTSVRVVVSQYDSITKKKMTFVFLYNSN